MDIYNLIKKQEKRKEYKEELFKKILQSAHRRIEFCSNSGDNYAIFTIPLYMPGFPLFDKGECCLYLLYELQQNGFEVRSYSDQYIYISWSHVLEKYKVEKNFIEYEETKLLGNNNNVDKNIKKSNELIFNNNTFNLLK